MSNTSKKTVARTDAPARRARRTSSTATDAPATQAPPAIPAIPEPAKLDDHQVAQLAYHYYVISGYQQGHALEHWLRAENELRTRA